MPANPDVLVLGGGVAGVAAALAAARAGARAVLVRRGPGATALVAGGWDAPPPEPLRAALADAGLALAACDGGLPHPDGILVDSRAAPVEHVRAALGSADERTLVCGIAGLPGFRPAALAALWADAGGSSSDGLPAAVVTLSETPPAGWSPAALAVRIERRPGEPGELIARAARQCGAGRVIVPAVFGLERSVVEDVAQAAGLMLGEALGGTPSIPGWRLDRALQRTLADAGVTLVRGHVLSHESGTRRTGAVTVAGDGGILTFRAAAVVLATGKFVGGGITAEQTYAESALGCDVAVERFGSTIADPGAALVLTDPARLEPQPLLAIGVRTDDAQAPLLASGDVAFENVVAAGTVRYGVPTSVGLGAAARDGWAAGTRAAAIAAT